MPGAFNIALSALNADTTAIDVVGNNLANLNTTGFKSSTVSFQELVSQSLGASGSAQVGAGVGGAQTTREFSQGSIQVTSGSLDAAIQGDGFFVSKDSQGNPLYSRAGNFRLDTSGNLLTQGGQAVQGWMGVNGVVNTGGSLTGIVVPTGTLGAPVATTQFSLSANLNAAAVVGQPEARFSAPIQVVDSLGTQHTLTVTFTKTASNAWSYAVTIPGEDTTGGTAGTPRSVATGSLAFNSQGVLTTPAASSGTVPVNVSGLADGAANLSLTWSLYGTDGQPVVTQFSQTSALSNSSQDGVTPATLVKVSLSDGGQIVGQYSNGKQLTIAQLALASIQNPDTLQGQGDSQFSASAATATPVVGVSGTGGRGAIVGGALESSTADMAREFTNLIVFQRAYQANSKVITTSDQLMQDTLNIKQ